MKWSPQQDAALKAVDHWFYTESKKKQIFRVFGFAGTGKTTLARHFADQVDGEVAYGAFTGKAALMMRKNGCFDARTIHSLLYKAIENEETGEVTFTLNPQSVLADAKLCIIDECSMVDEILAKDLLSFGVPILVLGDPAQLPPVNGAGFFTECDPDIMLTEIHRQARDNPIIDLATRVRMGGNLELGTYGDSRVILKPTQKDALDADQILVGRNATRETMNQRMRRLLGYKDPLPIKDERLICLKNDRDLGIFNGGMFTVGAAIKKNYPTNFHFLHLIREDEDGASVIAKVHKSFFTPEVPKPDWRLLKGSQEFDYGYAITTHKAQGSQWEHVMVYDESWCFRDDSLRWLYTSITRAQEKVTVVKG
jgi:exodeoxyribonuclease-5